MTEKRRVAITGVGVVSPVGIGTEAYWQGLLAPQPTEERRVHDFFKFGLIRPCRTNVVHNFLD